MKNHLALSCIPMQTHHLDAIFAIEQIAHSHPWSENLLTDLTNKWQHHHVVISGETLSTGLKTQKVLGYFYAQLIAGELTLLNIAVDPNHQGQGIGQYLLDNLLDLGEQLNAESAWLEVRESNHKAIKLYQAAGFNEIDRRHNYYPSANGQEDALIMCYLFL